MKKGIVIAAVLLLASIAVSFAAGPSLWPGALTSPSSAFIPILGEVGATKDVYIDNTARTTQSLYERGGGTWLSGGNAPIGMLLTTESKDVRFGFGGSTPTASTLHVFTAGASWPPLCPTIMSTGKWIAGGATDNVHGAMTPLY